MIRPHPITVFFKTRKYLYLFLIPFISGFYEYFGSGRLLKSLILNCIIMLAIISLAEWERRVTALSITENDITVKENLLVRSIRSFKFEHVTSVEIVNTPISRLFGTSKVQIYTRGGKRRQEKKFIIIKRRQADETVKKVGITVGKRLYKTDFLGVILGSFTNSFTTRLLIILPLIREAYDIAGNGIKETVKSQLQNAENIIVFIRWAAHAVTILMLIFFAISITTSIIRLWGFCVHDCDDFIMIRYGLVTKRSKFIRKSDISAAEVFKSPLMHLMSRYCCQIYAMSQSNGDSHGHTLLLPCKRETVERFTQKSGYVDNNTKGKSLNNAGKTFYLLWRPVTFMMLDLIATAILCLVFPKFWKIVIFTGTFFGIYIILCGIFLIADRKKLYIESKGKELYMCGRKKNYVSYVFMNNGYESVKRISTPWGRRKGVSKILIYPKSSGRIRFHTLIYESEQ